MSEEPTGLFFQREFKIEPHGRQILERRLHLREFGRRAVDFEALDVGDFQGFADQCSDALDVRQRTLGADIGFAAMHDITAQGEVVEEAAIFCGGLFNEARQKRPERFELAGVNFESGVDANDFISWSHF